MTTIVCVLLSLLFGGLIGLVAYWPLRKARRLYRLTASIALGLLTVLVSSLAFLSALFTYPSFDDERFAGQGQIEVVRKSLSNGKKDDDASEVRILLAFPRNARSNYDFTIRLVVSASPPLRSGNYNAILSTSKSFDVRPQFGCRLPDANPMPGVSCTTYASESELELRWDITPSNEGQPRFVLNLPTLWPADNLWNAKVLFGGRQPRECADADCSRDCANEDGNTHWNCPSAKPIVLSPQRPRFIVNSILSLGLDSFQNYRADLYNGAEVDLASNTLSFPIDVATTLGFNASTYGWLALAGTMVSGMLGSGWIWKLLEAFKGRSKTATAIIQDS
jgi:hypothetical protein